MSDNKKSPKMMKLEPGTYYWCSCGKSANQPFCDGSHKDTDKTPLEFKIEEQGFYSLCRCKATANPPYCDGSHDKI